MKLTSFHCCNLPEKRVIIQRTNAGKANPTLKSFHMLYCVTSMTPKMTKISDSVTPLK